MGGSLHAILGAALGALAGELAWRLPLMAAVNRLAGTGARAVHVLRSGAISEHWKEKAVGAYAGRTFMGTLRLAALLAVLIGAAVAVALVFDRITPGFVLWLAGWAGLGATTAGAVGWILIRRRLGRERGGA